MKIQLCVAALATAVVVSCISEPTLIECTDATARPDGLYECNQIVVRKDAPSCPVAAPVGPGNSPACTSDADCDPGSLCYCGELINEAMRDPSQGLCVPAGCRTSADCGEGEHCIKVYVNEAHYESEFYYEFRCTTPEDQCHQGDDCVASGDTCIFSASEGSLICEEEIVE
jgi:hypothetical protein